MSEWVKVVAPCQLPPEGVVVQTKVDDADGLRNEQPLKRHGKLWFFPDDSMYVYYTPTHYMMPAPDDDDDTTDPTDVWVDEGGEG